MRSRLLGSIVQAWLDGSGLWRSVAARRLGVSPSRVSRLVSGKRSTSAADVAGMAALCTAPMEQRIRALYLAESIAPDWLEPYGAMLPEQSDILTHAEQTATTVTEYQSLTVPELLQVPSYARLHIQATQHCAGQDQEQRVTQRMARQEPLDPTPPGYDDLGPLPWPPATTEFRFLLDQRVLDDRGIPPTVMREQIDHLVRVSVRPNVTVAVIPNRAPTWGCTSFRLYEFWQQLPAVCVISLNSVLVLENRAAVRAYRDALAGLGRAAMDPEASRSWLAAAGQRLPVPADDPPLSPDQSADSQT